MRLAGDRVSDGVNRADVEPIQRLRHEKRSSTARSRVVGIDVILAVRGGRKG